MTDLTNETRLELYRKMLLIRRTEERIAELYPEQEMRCPVHLCIGQEAAAVGSAMALTPRDYAVSGHRSHGHYLAKGGDLGAMMAEIYGKETGCAGGKGGSMHLVDLDAGFLGAVPIVGSTIPIGVGTAFRSHMKKDDRVTMVFFGDGAVETGVVHESMNFAALHGLPVIFVCENNLYSVYSPMEVRQPDGRPIVDLARAHGIGSHSLDGNDVEAVHSACIDLVESARTGKGPAFLELATYRWLEHCGPNFDNHVDYRTQEEYEAWAKRDPLNAYRKRLETSPGVTDDALKAIEAEVTAEIDTAVHFAKSSPFPAPETASQHVYADQGRS